MNPNIFLPALAGCWGVLLVLVFLRPQRLFNSFLLLLNLLVTLAAAAALFGEHALTALTVIFVFASIALLMAPALLIANGLEMARRESRSLANLLSLLLGIFVGLGEIAFGVSVILIPRAGSAHTVSRIVVFVGLSVFYFSALILTFVIYTLFIQILPHRRRYDYVIIHGCGLADGKKVTPLLASRLDKAVALFRKSRGRAVLIPSGGQGGDEKLPEAEAMKSYLLEKGVPADKILPEDKSTNTRENLLFSKEIIDGREGRKRLALVTSSYHVYRCIALARELGIPCVGIGAKVTGYFWSSAVIREFAAVFSTKKNLILTAAGYLVFVIAPMCVFLFA